MLPKHEAQIFQANIGLGHCSKLPWTLLDLQFKQNIQTRISKVTTALRIYARESIKSIYYNTFIRRSQYFFSAATNHLQQSSELFLTLYSVSSQLQCSTFISCPHFLAHRPPCQYTFSLITLFSILFSHTPFLIFFLRGASSSSSHQRHTLISDPCKWRSFTLPPIYHYLRQLSF